MPWRASWMPGWWASSAFKELDIDQHSPGPHHHDDQDLFPEKLGQVTELLQLWKQADEGALRALMPVVYKELRRLAHYYLRSERPDHTLQSTELVHKAYTTFGGSAGTGVVHQNLPHQPRSHRDKVCAIQRNRLLANQPEIGCRQKAGKRDLTS